MEGRREGREVTMLAEGKREALIRLSDLEDERRVPAFEYASEQASERAHKQDRPPLHRRDSSSPPTSL